LEKTKPQKDAATARRSSLLFCPLTGHPLHVPDAPAVRQKRPVLSDAERVRHVPDEEAPIGVDAYHLRPGGAQAAPQRRGVADRRSPPATIADGATSAAVVALDVAVGRFVADGPDVDVVVFFRRINADAAAAARAPGSTSGSGSGSGSRRRRRRRQVGDFLQLSNRAYVGAAERGRAGQRGDVLEAVGPEHADEAIGAGGRQEAVLVHVQPVRRRRLERDPVLENTSTVFGMCDGVDGLGGCVHRTTVFADMG